MSPGHVLSGDILAGFLPAQTVLAEVICFPGSNWRNNRSPIGERQILPVQTTKMESNIIAATI
jgi:hypothetical protein